MIVPKFIILLFNLIYEAISTFTTNLANSNSTNISFLAQLNVNCTLAGKVGIVTSFQYYDDNTNAYYKYECSFTSQISQNPLNLLTSYTSYFPLGLYYFSYLEILCPQNFSSGVMISPNTALQSFVLEITNDAAATNSTAPTMRYKYICVNFVQVSNSNPIKFQNPSLSSSCSMPDLYNNFKLLQGPGNGTIDNTMLLTGFKLNVYTNPSNCVIEYNYTRAKSCDLACNSCSGSSATQCISCATGYYYKNNSRSECYNSPPPGYYLSTLWNAFIPCNNNCNNCSATIDSNGKENVICSLCSSGYLIIEGQGICSNTSPVNYYLDIINNKYRLCYKLCQTCSNSGNSTLMNCLTCQSGYYMMSNNASQCYSSSSVPSNYLLINNQFQPCYDSCASCNIIGNLSNSSCLSCASNYYPLFLFCLQKLYRLESLSFCSCYDE